MNALCKVQSTCQQDKHQHISHLAACIFWALKLSWESSLSRVMSLRLCVVSCCVLRFHFHIFCVLPCFPFLLVCMFVSLCLSVLFRQYFLCTPSLSHLLFHLHLYIVSAFPISFVSSLLVFEWFPRRVSCDFDSWFFFSVFDLNFASLSWYFFFFGLWTLFICFLGSCSSLFCLLFWSAFGSTCSFPLLTRDSLFHSSKEGAWWKLAACL